jgi:hypothetical protein
VQITALGVTRRAGGAGSALHLRFTVNNRGDDKPWRIDTREVTVFVNCGGRICSMHATQEGGAPALLELAEGQQQSVDLDFTLPPGLQSASRVPAFIVAWQVTTGSGALARRTGFRRERRNADGSAADEDEDIARDYPSSWMESGHAGR